MKRVMSGEENSELLMLVCSKLKFCFEVEVQKFKFKVEHEHLS